MKNLKPAAAAIALATAMGGAQAVTLLSENFDASNSFAGGTLVNDGADDFLLLSGNLGTATQSISFTQALSSLTLSFWYAGFGASNATVSLGNLLNVTLPATASNANPFNRNNPGPDQSGNGAFDKYFETTLQGVAGGNYLLTFTRGTGSNAALKFDDVQVTGLAAPVPEPQTYTLLLAGLGVVGWVARRRRPRRD